jgi:hypothetical protein
VRRPVSVEWVRWFFFRQDFSSGLAVGPVSGVLLGGGARKGSDGFPPVRFSKTNLRKASRSINLISAVLLKGRFLVCGSLPGASTRLPTRNEQAATVFYLLRSSVQHRQVVASGLNPDLAEAAWLHHQSGF